MKRKWPYERYRKWALEDIRTQDDGREVSVDVEFEVMLRTSNPDTLDFYEVGDIYLKKIEVTDPGTEEELTLTDGIRENVRRILLDFSKKHDWAA